MKSFATLATMAVLCAATLSAQGQDWAKPRLEKSPRHLDYVTVKNGDRSVNCFIAYPQVKEKATAVIVIHEIYGLSDWAKGLGDQLAEAGDRKSTRLNSSHLVISYAVFCLKKKK